MEEVLEVLEDAALRSTLSLLAQATETCVIRRLVVSEFAAQCP